MGSRLPNYCPLFHSSKWTPKGFFPASRGSRQGEPLWPFLFTLVANSLSQTIINAKSIGLFKRFQAGDDKVNASQIQFADDTLLLMDEEQSNISILKFFPLFWISLRLESLLVPDPFIGHFIYRNQMHRNGNCIWMCEKIMAFWIIGFTFGRFFKEKRILGPSRGQMQTDISHMKSQ